MNINVKMKKNFQTQLNKLREKYGEEFDYLNGIGETQLSFTDFIDNFIDKETVADASVDANSNSSNKSVVGLINEMAKPHQALLALNKIYHEIHKKYGFKTANDWLEANYSRRLYMHDLSTATMKSYCFAYDLKDIAEKGLFFVKELNAKPAQHLGTFISHLREFVMYASAQTSGAVGMANVIPYMYYFWKKDCDTGYASRSPEYHRENAIQTLVYLLNQSAVRNAQESAFTNVSIFDKPYLTALFGGATFPDGSFMIDELDGIMEFQKVFLKVASKIRSENMFTFPVLTISLLYDGGFKDEEFARWAVEHNREWGDSNLFIDKTVTSLSNCCRLKGSLGEMKEKWSDAYFNSIGGTALKVGSVKVSTLNLAGIALSTDDKQEFLVKVRDYTRLNCQALDAQRHIIKRNVEKGLLPIFEHGLIDFEHCYSTVGVGGIFETLVHFGLVETDEFNNTYYTKDSDEFAKEIFEVIHTVIKDFILDKDYVINLEAPPMEQAAVKMQQADKILYPDTVVDILPLYGNQFIPLGVQTTLQERLRVATLYDEFCSGGSICHLNIDKPFSSFEVAWEMVNEIAKLGLTYFAFNTRIQACKNNHGFYGTACPTCGEPVESEYTRTVGFFTKINNWSKERKEEYKLRQWETIDAT